MSMTDGLFISTKSGINKAQIFRRLQSENFEYQKTNQAQICAAIPGTGDLVNFCESICGFTKRLKISFRDVLHSVKSL